ncbi:MAG: ABC transporter ATP-binding protein [Gemmobacter sp.]
MSLLSLDSLTVHRGPCPVVDRVTLTVEPGEVVGLIGPNGAGKTTLMRAALGLMPHRGRSNLAAMPPATRARAVAFLPQTREVAWPVDVATLVALGRLPHLAGRPGPADRTAVDRALGRLGLGSLRGRRATELSGGELARVLMARALAQEAPLLIADEPAAGLDPEGAIRAMTVLRDLSAEGRGVLVSVHDLGLAARHCDRVALMHKGRLVAVGPPAAVLDDARLADVFGITVFRAEAAGPVLQPLDVIR